LPSQSDSQHLDTKSNISTNQNLNDDVNQNKKDEEMKEVIENPLTKRLKEV